MHTLPFTSDESIQAAILAALAADYRTSKIALHIGVLNSIAHLAGLVDSLQECMAAETIARRVKGVRGVVNLSWSANSGSDSQSKLKGSKSTDFKRREGKLHRVRMKSIGKECQPPTRGEV